MNQQLPLWPMAWTRQTTSCECLSSLSLSLCFKWLEGYFRCKFLHYITLNVMIILWLHYICQNPEKYGMYNDQPPSHSVPQTSFTTNQATGAHMKGLSCCKFLIYRVEVTSHNCLFKNRIGCYDYRIVITPNLILK